MTLLVVFALFGVPLILGGALVSMFRRMATEPPPESQDDYERAMAAWADASRPDFDRSFTHQNPPPQSLAPVRRQVILPTPPVPSGPRTS